MELFLQKHARNCTFCKTPQSPSALRLGGLGAKGELWGSLELEKPDVFD